MTIMARRSFFPWALTLSLIASSLACAAGEDDVGGQAGSGAQATGASDTGGENSKGGGGHGGVGGTAEAGSAQGGSGGAGGALSGNIELCVLNEGDAYDPCQQPEELDYGVVSTGTTELRTFRVDNETDGEVLFKSASVADNAFSVEVVRYEEDPGNQGSYLRVVESLPLARATGQSLWFEVTYEAIGSAGPLPDLDVVVKMNFNDNPIEDMLVPIVGEESGCSPGTGACDADPNNGCETNTDTSVEHCGQCNHPCDPAGGTGQCVGGQCQLTGCDPFMANCNLMDDDGCEVNTLNDVVHCGSCSISCVKDNTDSFCNGGNCNIIGCTNNYGDCNLNPADGCETNLANTMAHCGGCNLNCDLPHAAETCVPSQVTGLGVCTLGACEANYKNCDTDPSNGCEVNITNDLANCGNCGVPCNYDHASEACIGGGCIMGQCDQDYANCNAINADGCEAHLTDDKDHCGTCGTDCDSVFPGSSVSCVASACQFNGCLPGHWDLDGNSANGCEYTCTFQSATDLPDNGFVDANCDGIDGDVNAAIFVATTGNDTWPGTKTQPMMTVAAAVGKAVSTGKTQIYVSNGIYIGRVTLSNGVSIYGGYSAGAGWARSDFYVATIRSTSVANGRMNALEGTNITSPTTVDRMTIETTSTSTTGVSNYAVYCNHCDGLILSNNDITAGSAGGGGSGSAGSTGASAVDGIAGNNGDCDAGYGTGGGGGSSSCGKTGGGGGRGGTEGSNPGVMGGVGITGTSGGAPGAGGDPGAPGHNGATGTNGATGSAGSAGSGGAVVSNFWVSSTGGTAGTGGHGNGGGGGGGGGGQGCFLCNDGGGNGGGGGGGGGCGGGGASGGTGGGGSFGVFLVNSTGIQLVANTITSGNGGAGGSGGTGGSGGFGGSGANGALGISSDCADETGPGGNGGDGGNGGVGGGGGGGAGGPSWAVYRFNTSASVAGNALSNGTPGSGGSGGSPNGVTGATGASGGAF